MSCCRKNSGKFITDKSSIIPIPLEVKKRNQHQLKLAKVTYENKIIPHCSLLTCIMLFSQKIFTQDVDNFWKTYDKIIKQKTPHKN